MDSELKSLLSTLDGAIKSITENQQRYNEKQTQLQRQVDALDIAGQPRFSGAGLSPAFIDLLKSSESLTRVMADRKGSAVVTLKDTEAAPFIRRGRKAILTEGGPPSMFPTSGVLVPDRISGITTEPRQTLMISDVLFHRPTTAALVDYVKVANPMTIASPTPEAGVKPEESVTFAAASERVKTIAAWQPVSRQAMDDMTELAAFLQTSLVYYVDLAEEIQLLAGDNSGENLNGLIPQSTKLLAPGGATAIDTIGVAIETIENAKEIPPSFVVLNPKNWWGMKLAKDSLGRFLLGDPQSITEPKLFGLDVVSTTSISQNGFLVGSGDPTAAEVRDRMEVQFEVSTSHADYFTKNLIACRAERRLALVCKRPGSFVSGTLPTSSPL
jgi:HK97 family phage major capsid protein